MARKILFSLVIVLLMASVGQAQVELAKSGQAKAVIVLSDLATDREKTAAKELQKYLGKITGAKFAISNSPNVPEGQSRIFVGDSPAVRDIAGPVKWESLGPDDIVIKTVGKDLILAGGPRGGTMIAVYSFLQDIVGCRWWTGEAESIPSKPNLTVPDTNIVYHPPFDFRVITAGKYAGRKPFIYKLRLSTDTNFDPDGGSILRELLPERKYFMEHPDWYAYIPEGDKGKGKYTWDFALKYMKEDGNEEKYELVMKTRRLPKQPCMTNEEVLQTVTQNVLEHLKEEYHKWKYQPKIVWIVQQDGRYYCKCDRCKALSEKEGSESAAWVKFLNSVSERVEKDYPDVLIGMHAYLFTIKPPKTIKPRDNIVIYMAVLDRNHKIPVGELPDIKDYAKKWCQLAKHVYLWDYTANFRNFIFPHPNHYVIGPSIKYCYDVGFNGMRIQGSFGKLSEFVYMRNWMIAQLMWDPTLDDRALMKEFLDGYYGAASPYLQKYIDLLDEIIHRDGGKHLSCYLTSTEGWLTLEDLNTATNLINQAATAVAGDATLSKRVRRLRYSVEVVWLERYEEFKKEAAEKGIAFLGPKNPQVLLKHLEKIQHEVGQYKEGRQFSEYMEKLKELFQSEQP